MPSQRMPRSGPFPSDSFYRQLIDSLSDGVYFVDLESRISYWNAGAERITGYKKEEIVGQLCHDTPLKHVDETGALMCGPKCPLGSTCRDGEVRQTDLFLHHREGHRIPVHVRASAIRHREGMILGAAEVFTDQSSRVEAIRRVQDLEHLAFLDTLTGVGNRRFCVHVLQQRLAELDRHGWPFALLFLDIDHFKDINDSHGHLAGDAVLKMVAKTLMHLVRASDFVGRWGGEEFVILSVQPGYDGLRIAAERMRAAISASEVHGPFGTLSVSASIGATMARPGDSVEAILARADALMYASKNDGRNRVTLAGTA